MMEFAELNDFSLWEARRQEGCFGKSNVEMIPANCLKLSKKIEEIRTLLKQKNVETIKRKLSDDFADSIIIMGILAKRLNIDLEDAVTNKMEIVRARKYK